MHDMILLAARVVSFALAITTHVLIVAGLLKRRLAGRAVLAMAIPPLAPYFAFTRAMKVRAAIWVAAVVGYICLYFVSR